LGTLEKLITKETKEIESTIKMVESAMKEAGLPFRKRQATVIVG
jgi:hypothetical protein